MRRLLFLTRTREQNTFDDRAILSWIFISCEHGFDFIEAVGLFIYGSCSYISRYAEAMTWVYGVWAFLKRGVWRGIGDKGTLFLFSFN